MFSNGHDQELARYINLKLAALGQPTSLTTADRYFLEMAGPLLRNYYQKDQLLGDRLCPADTRIQAFLDAYLSDVAPGGAPRLPSNAFALDRPGLARVMSLPPDEDFLSSPYLQSYRLPQGILHNPKSDRRTTQGVFHIVEGGLPIPADKIAVPKNVFASLLAAALRPPQDVMALPFTANQDEQVRLFVTLLLRPLVCPATASDPAKSTEIRFFAPASLVSNLDFVEAFSATAAIPIFPENDSALDVLHWTGHTGCVILAPPFDRPEKERSRPPPLRRRDRAAAPRRHVLARPRRRVQRRRIVQNRLPRQARRHGHHHRRQLLRLLQEGSKDADQLLRQSLRPVRGRARRRRHRLSPPTCSACNSTPAAPC